MFPSVSIYSKTYYLAAIVAIDWNSGVAFIISLNKCDIIEIIAFDTLVSALFAHSNLTLIRKPFRAKQKKMNLDPAQQKKKKTR